MHPLVEMEYCALPVGMRHCVPFVEMGHCAPYSGNKTLCTVDRICVPPLGSGNRASTAFCGIDYAKLYKKPTHLPEKSQHLFSGKGT